MYIVILCQNPSSELKKKYKFQDFSQLTNTHYGDFPIQVLLLYSIVVLVKRIFVGIFEEG